MSSIKGIGNDIALISRFKNKSEHFIKRVLSLEEYDVYISLSEENKLTYLASRFSAKEALFKAYKNLNFDFAKVSVLNKENGEPFVKMDSPDTIHISISHDGDYVVTFVIIE